MLHHQLKRIEQIGTSTAFSLSFLDWVYFSLALKTAAQKVLDKRLSRILCCSELGRGGKLFIRS